MKRVLFTIITLSALILTSCSNSPTITLKAKCLGVIYFEELPDDALIVYEKWGNLCIYYNLDWKYCCSERDIKPVMEISGDTLFIMDSITCSCDEEAYYELQYKIHHLPYGKYVLIYGFRNSMDLQKQLKEYPNCRYFHPTEIEFKPDMKPIGIISDSCENWYVVDSTIVWVAVESMPEFPKGTSAMHDYIDSHKMLVNSLNPTLRPIVQFVVERDGSLSNIKVVRSSGIEKLDKDAVSVVANMPKWKPGKHRGVPVRVQYIIPIDYKSPTSSQNTTDAINNI